MERVKSQLQKLHSSTPLLKKLPPRAVAIVMTLGVLNCLVWAASGVVLRFHPGLTGSAILAYTFGLRHALDADHISAIDLMTRRLVASQQRPVTVGTWFSLGHSTVVVITSLVVAATASAISKKFSSFSYLGGIIGSSVSATFLLILGCVNAYILVVLVRQMRKLLGFRAAGVPDDEEFRIQGGGCLFHLFKTLFRLIDRPWKMYPLGIMFGLGFDTSSEIALLGLSSLRAAQGTSLWLILIFPVLFTAGMCLLDTLDGALMMALYTSASLAKDKIAILYYNIILTFLTVLVAVIIGVFQWLGLALAIIGDDPAAHQGFWKGVTAVQDSWDIVGGGICGLFVLTGVLSVVLYAPWRRRVDKEILEASVRGEEGGVAKAQRKESASVTILDDKDIELDVLSSNKVGDTKKEGEGQGHVVVEEIKDDEISGESSGVVRR